MSIIIFNYLAIMLNNPLDQFDFMNVFLHLSISNTLYLTFFMVFIYLVSFSVLFNSFSSTCWIQMTKFIKNIYYVNFYTKRKEHTLFFLFLFLFLIFMNFAGLLPYNFTLSSLLSLTFFFSMAISSYTIVILILMKKNRFFSLFLPTTTILWISPMLVLIEMISYFSRILSLSLRLFANMVAGHALIKIAMIYFFFLFSTNSWLSAFFIWFAMLLIFILEILMAFLQAYVMILLINLFYSQDVNTQ